MTEAEIVNDTTLLAALELMRASTTRSHSTICSCCGSRVSLTLNNAFNIADEYGSRVPVDQPEALIVSHWTDVEKMADYMAKPFENIERFLIPDSAGDALLEWRDL